MLLRFLNLPHVQFAISRYLLIVPCFVELLLYARLLGPADFGIYALIAQLVGFSAILTLGSGSGYLHAYYNRSKDPLDTTYISGSIVHYLAAGLIAAGVLSLINPVLALSVPLFLIQAPQLILEPMLRVRNRFSLSLLGKGVSSSLSVLALGAILYFSHSRTLLWHQAVVVLFGTNALGYGAYYLYVRQLHIIKISLKDVGIALLRPATYALYVKRVVQPAGLFIISSMSYLLFTFIDRIFLESVRSPEPLGVYVLSWQLLQGALVIVEASNAIWGIRIGESLESADLAASMRRFLVYSLLLCLGVWGCYLLGGFLLSTTLYADFPDLLPIMLFVSTGYFVQGVAGANTNLLFLKSRFGVLIAASLFSLVTSIAGNLAAMYWEWWYGYPIIVSSIALSLANLWLLWILYYRVIPQLGISISAPHPPRVEKELEC